MMLRPASRGALRTLQSSLSPARTIGGRRFVSSQPPHLRSRSWKSSALRWGVAIAGIYYYNTSPVFAEQPQSNLLNPNLDALDDSNDASQLDALTSRRAKKAEQNAAAIHSAADALSSENASTSVSEQTTAIAEPGVMGSPGDLEEEAEGEGAFNPETGEINWDCPCLGGMAHGPCGPEFREAFSCFVFSKEEPKGMDCIEKFESMRTCFQAHPDVYKDELMDDEEIDAELEKERQELVKEISERKQGQQDDIPQHRLLEEPVPPSRSSKPGNSSVQSTSATKAKSQSTVSSSRPADAKEGREAAVSPSTSTAEKPQSPSKKTSTSSSNPSTEPSRMQKNSKNIIDQKDNVLQVQTPPTTESRDADPSPASEAAIDADDVVPKAAHDAR